MQNNRQILLLWEILNTPLSLNLLVYWIRTRIEMPSGLDIPFYSCRLTLKLDFQCRIHPLRHNIFCNFVHFFWKIWQNHMLAPPLRGILDPSLDFGCKEFIEKSFSNYTHEIDDKILHAHCIRFEV